MLQDPMTEIDMALQVNYFQLNSAEYFTGIAMKIPGSELALARKGGAERTTIDLIGEVKDEYGSTVGNIRDHVDQKLSGETAAQLSRQPIEWDTNLVLLPGSYAIKVLARDDETGRIGTYIRKFVIPNLDKEATKVADEFGGIRKPTHRYEEGRAVHFQESGQRAHRQSVDSGRHQAPAQHQQRIQQEPRPIRLSAGLRKGGRDAKAAGGFCDLLSRPGQGV